MKERKYAITSIDAEKAFAMIQHPFILKIIGYLGERK